MLRGPDRGISDDLNVRKERAGSIDGVGNDFNPVGIVILIAHERHDLGTALLGVQDQPKNGSFLMGAADDSAVCRKATVIGVFSYALPDLSAEDLPPIGTSAKEKCLDDSRLVVALIRWLSSPASQFVASFSA